MRSYLKDNSVVAVSDSKNSPIKVGAKPQGEFAQIMEQTKVKLQAKILNQWQHEKQATENKNVADDKSLSLTEKLINKVKKKRKKDKPSGFEFFHN